MKKFCLLGAMSMLAILSACSDDSSSKNSPVGSDDNPSGIDALSSADNGLAESSSSISTAPDTVRFDASGLTGEFTDSRDGHVYKIVKIGNQVWMAENLTYGHDDVELADCGQWSVYPLTCEQYNSQIRFDYSWAEIADSVNTGCGETDRGVTVNGIHLSSCPLAMPSQSVCPNGWHVPSVKELQTLVDYVGGSKVAGDALKSASGWSGVANGTDKYGFNVKPSYRPIGDEETCLYSTEQNADGSFKVLCVTGQNGYAEFVDTRRQRNKKVVRCIQGEGRHGLDYKVNVAENTYAGIFGSMTDPRDGQIYKTVEIGEQTWMAENLKYNNKEFYEYEEVMDAEVTHCYLDSLIWGWDYGMWSPCPVKQPVQGICPEGWHLPTYDEWSQLSAYVSGVDYSDDFVSSDIAGYMLKSTSGWPNEKNGIDAFGFGANPSNDKYDELYFWAGTTTGWDTEYFGNDFFVIQGKKARAEALSLEVPWNVAVRCIKGTGSHEPMSWPSYEDDEPESSSSSVAAYSGSYGELKDDRDGNVYRTVKIGKQTWMADNLKFETADGKSLCNCADMTSCDSRGRLYPWKSAQTACPSGWHLPSLEEMEELVSVAEKVKYDLGGNIEVSSFLKDTSGWAHVPGNNYLGFSALPAGFGYLDVDGNASEDYCGAIFNSSLGEDPESLVDYWTSSENADEKTHAALFLDEDKSEKYDLIAWTDFTGFEGDEAEFNRLMAFAIRCLKD